MRLLVRPETERTRGSITLRRFDLKRQTRAHLVLLALGALAACERAPDAASVVAEGAGHELTVDDVVSLLVGERYPNEIQVPYTVGELWVDYVLLATAVSDDPTLEQLDLSRIIDQQVEQELILALREATVDPDTVVTEEEIERRFAQVSPEARVRARHIFLAPPANATAAQRDSVREFAAGLRERILAGESFEALAAEHSDDPGTAGAGGDLGFVNRNELFGALDSAAFALQPGEVSGIVTSVYGYHVLRVDERHIPTMEDARPQVRATIQQERILAAERDLITSVEAQAGIEIEEGAAELTRRAAESPGMRLSRRARERALVSYRGGKVTMWDVVTFMQSRQPQLRVDIYSASDDEIEQGLLLALAQRKLLADAARERGLSIPAARQDSLTRELRERLVSTASDLGLMELPRGNGAEARAARGRHAQDAIRGLLRSEREAAPLGSFSFILRERYGGQVNFPGVQRVVERIDMMRVPDAAAPAPGEGPLAPGLSPLDSAPPGTDPAGGLPPGDVPPPGEGSR
jgi:hypothetical protein